MGVLPSQELTKNITITEIQNNIFTIQECSIHERGNRNDLYISLKDHS